MQGSEGRDTRRRRVGKEKGKEERDEVEGVRQQTGFMQSAMS